MMLVVDKVEPVETVRKLHRRHGKRHLTSGMPLKASRINEEMMYDNVGTHGI